MGESLLVSWFPTGVFFWYFFRKRTFG